MTAPATPCLHSFEFQAATRLVVGAGALARVGDIARQLGGSRALLVSDPGLVATGFPAKAEELLASANIACRLFQDFSENPSTDHVTAGVAVAEDFQPDILIALGGGSSMDCAKGINFVHCFGGSMHDYHGRERAGLNRGPMPERGVRPNRLRSSRMPPPAPRWPAEIHGLRFGWPFLMSNLPSRSQSGSPH
jgi:hypothetical protein